MSTTENGRRGYSSDVTVRQMTPVPNPVLVWLAEHGEGTAQDMVPDLRREADSIGAALRAFKAEGRVRAVRQEPGPTGGRPRQVYALVVEQQVNEEVPEVDMAMTEVATKPEPAAVTSEELAAAARTVELTAEDMDELLNGFCGTVALCEADSSTLLFLLRMRRVQDTLRMVEAAAA